MKLALPTFAIFVFLHLPAAAQPASITAQCMGSAHSELDRIASDIRAIDREPDAPVRGYLVGQKGPCAKLLAQVDQDTSSVLPGEIAKFERKACLKLNELRINNFCKCAANTGDTSLPDDATIENSFDAQKKFTRIAAVVDKLGMRDPSVRSYVQAGQQLVGCWSAKTIVLLNRVSDQIQSEAFSSSAPSVSAISGTTPSVSAINGGVTPSVSPVDGGSQTSISPSPSSTETYSGALQSGISGPTSVPYSTPTPSSSPDYRTSGAGTNVTKDVIDFTNAYNRSANSLPPIRTPSPPPVMHSAPAPTAPQRSSPSHSGISGGGRH